MSQLNSVEKRRVALIVAILVGLNGIVNIAIGAWAFLSIDSLNLPDRLSTLDSLIDSLDPSLIGSTPLSDQISNLKAATVEELEVLIVQSQNLNVISAYLIIQGIVFAAISLCIYFIIPKKEIPHL